MRTTDRTIDRTIHRTIDMPGLTALAQAQSSPSLVLCSTARLARSLQDRYAQQMQQGGDTQWPTLQVRTVDGWLGQQQEWADLMGWLQDSALQCPALTAEQELLLWEQVIADDLGEGARHVFDLPALAATAAQANELAHTWNVPVPGSSDSAESQRFARWRGLFQRRCEELGVIDAAWQKTALVSTLLALPPWRDQLPRCIVWAGFDRYTPQHLLLQQRLAEDVSQYELAPQERAGDCRVVSYPDVASECLAAALWAQEELKRQPDARLAIVVPNLAAVRNPLQDALEDVLQPWAVRAGYAEDARLFNFSLGLPLSQYPLVRAALQMLELASQTGLGQRVDYATVSQLVLDPLAWGGDAALLGAIDAALRKSLPKRCTLAAVLAQAQKLADKWKEPRVLQALQPVQALTGLAPFAAERHAPSQWAAHWYTLLGQAGWMRGRACSSHEFQTKEALERELQQLADLDAVLQAGEAGALPVAEALRLLRRRCGKRIFQPKTEGAPPVQVLGVLEASGLRFDAAWILGMVDTVWPPPARPNALLGMADQRKACAPSASADIELEFARKVQAQLLRCAPRVTLSWPQTADGADLMPSPLLGAEGERLPTPAGVAGVHCPLPEDEAGQTGATAMHGAEPGSQLPPQQQGAYTPTRWADPVQDDQAPPVAEGERVQGGTWLLRAQAVCPAWAFYQYRLHTSRLEEPADGLDARQRGTLLHAVLAHFWKAVRSSAQLAELAKQAEKGEDGIVRQVRASIEAALQAHAAAPHNPPLPPRFRALEAKRLERLVLRWVELERARKLPFTVASCEEQRELTIEGLQIRVSADRMDCIHRSHCIDQVDQVDPSGSNDPSDPMHGNDPGQQVFVVIDYKTGTAIDFRNWATQRLTEPQLPLYATWGVQAGGAQGGGVPTTQAGAAGVARVGAARAVLFAKVLARQPGWAGLSEWPDVAPQVKVLDDPKGGRKLFPAEQFPHWDAVLQHWRAALIAVAREVREGVAAVRFEDAKAMEYCDVLPLLRLPERKAQLEQARRIPPVLTHKGLPSA
ncbi:PD-(D/E)XK nuclease family protein [Candidatus Symbiobacter mobilis]|uniref:PD-(D/E)XK endonuclease-like domain-containing protein n=1 Tax=Candidatus Symbiobacter mobilis CR TaxID=946483 RepID=U5NAE9_9BURK|nr:PD-(D/E)XK nuclease family protein [Candidatus Symbiobacter mobilis]AGX88295.1 hypothetical protein Cenrod_2228 [Candidatus Symbiobacter mobilis CR]